MVVSPAWFVRDKVKIPPPLKFSQLDCENFTGSRPRVIPLDNFTELSQLFQRQQRAPSSHEIEIALSYHLQYLSRGYPPNDFYVFLIVERTRVRHVLGIDDEVGRNFCHHVLIHRHCRSKNH